jgi:hypothetical protein
MGELLVSRNDARRRADNRIVVLWRIVGLALIAVNGAVAITVPIAFVQSGRTKPVGAEDSFYYQSAPGWPAWSPPSIIWWVLVAGAVAVTIMFTVSASPRLRGALMIMLPGSWILVGGFTSLVGVYFAATPSWPHDLVWAGCALGACGVVCAVASRSGARRRVVRS